MLMRHRLAGSPLMRTRTGSGFFHPGLIALARAALTRTQGLMPRISMMGVERSVRSGMRDAHQTAAEGFAGEEPAEGAWCVLQTVDDFFAEAQFAVTDPVRELGARFVELGGVVVDDQAFHLVAVGG